MATRRRLTQRSCGDAVNSIARTSARIKVRHMETREGGREIEVFSLSFRSFLETHRGVERTCFPLLRERERGKQREGKTSETREREREWRSGGNDVCFVFYAFLSLSLSITHTYTHSLLHTHTHIHTHSYITKVKRKGKSSQSSHRDHRESISESSTEPRTTAHQLPGHNTKSSATLCLLSCGGR
jgi:hypothetical protein